MAYLHQIFQHGPDQWSRRRGELDGNVARLLEEVHRSFDVISEDDITTVHFDFPKAFSSLSLSSLHNRHKRTNVVSRGRGVGDIEIELRQLILDLLGKSIARLLRYISRLGYWWRSGRSNSDRRRRRRRRGRGSSRSRSRSRSGSYSSLLISLYDFWHSLGRSIWLRLC